MENIFAFTPLVIACIPVALGIVQVAKVTGVSDRFAPLASLVIGIGLVALTGAVWQVAIAQGIIVGLAASGLYSGTKAAFVG